MGREITETTPAEQRAERDALPVVAVSTFELLRVASGNPMIVGTLDGKEVLLRLATADEVRQFQAAAMADMPEDARPPLMTEERAAELVQPLPF